jgi:hypothetical protein
MLRRKGVDVLEHNLHKLAGERLSAIELKVPFVGLFFFP